MDEKIGFVSEKKSIHEEAFAQQEKEKEQQERDLFQKQEEQLDRQSVKAEDFDFVELDISAVEKEEKLPAGPQLIGFDRRFAGFKTKKENHEIILIRIKLKEYYEVPETNPYARYVALKELDKACGSYIFLRFTMFKGKRVKQMKREVEELRHEVQAELKKIDKKSLQDAKAIDRNTTSKRTKEDQKLEKDLEKRARLVRVGGNLSMGAKLLAGTVGVARFLVENPVRLALKVVTVPFWAVNEAARGIVKATGHKPQRHLRFPGLYSPSTYSDRTVRTFRRWFHGNNQHYDNLGVTNRYRSLHNNDGGGSNWYDAFLTDYHSDKLDNKNLFEEEADYRKMEAGQYEYEYEDEEEEQMMNGTWNNDDPSDEEVS